MSHLSYLIWWFVLETETYVGLTLYCLGRCAIRAVRYHMTRASCAHLRFEVISVLISFKS